MPEVDLLSPSNLRRSTERRALEALLMATLVGSAASGTRTSSNDQSRTGKRIWRRGQARQGKNLTRRDRLATRERYIEYLRIEIPWREEINLSTRKGCGEISSGV
jgi:hypothetical protein